MSSESATVVVKSPKDAYEYALTVMKKFPEGEAAIAKSSKFSFYYARDVIKGRFALGEKAILGSHRYGKPYAALCKAWDSGVTPSLRIPDSAVEDAPPVENGIINAKDSKPSLEGFREEEESPSLEAEIQRELRAAVLASKDAGRILNFLVDNDLGPWPEAEHILAKVGQYAYQYAYLILKGRFPAGEKLILSFERWGKCYRERILGWDATIPATASMPIDTHLLLADSSAEDHGSASLVEALTPEDEPCSANSRTVPPKSSLLDAEDYAQILKDQETQAPSKTHTINLTLPEGEDADIEVIRVPGGKLLLRITGL